MSAVMMNPRINARWLYLIAFVATFWAGYLFHGSSLPAQSQQYLDHVLQKAGMHQPPTTAPPAPHQDESPAVTPAKGDGSPSVDGSGYTPDRWFFQADVEYELPQFDVQTLRRYAPRNYKGPGHEAFATFYLSRNASLHDPYYLATMQVIYRLLWEQNSRSKKHPVVVFVAPFVTDEQRSYFEAAGAMVREVASRPFSPTHAKTPVAERLKDVFSKLEMWNQTDFTRIAYLDSDAFPLMNIDLLLADSLVPDLRCNENLLSANDRQFVSEGLCDYAFGAVLEAGTDMLNAGVMVLRPNEHMHSILLREYEDGNNFDQGFVEQSLLTYIYRPDGPFPATTLPQAWNGAPQVRDEGNPLFIVHGKLWALYFKVDHWASSLWEDTWTDLLRLYESTGFAQIRAKDESRARPQAQDADISKWHLDD